MDLQGYYCNKTVVSLVLVEGGVIGDFSLLSSIYRNLPVVARAFDVLTLGTYRRFRIL